MSTFSELVQAVQKYPKLFTVGTVAAVYDDTMSCKITPEEGGEDIDDVPIRVMRYANQIGFSVVPKVGTEAIVIWLDDHRPTVFQIHEWDKVVVKNQSDVGMIIESGGVMLGNTAGESHPVGWGDEIADYLVDLRDWIAEHSHPDHNLAPNPPSPDPVPPIESQEVKVS